MGSNVINKYDLIVYFKVTLFPQNLVSQLDVVAVGIRRIVWGGF